MIAINDAYIVANLAITPIARVMVGHQHVDHCKRFSNHARCRAHVYGSLEDIRLIVRETQYADGSLRYVVSDIEDCTPKPDPFPLGM